MSRKLPGKAVPLTRLMPLAAPLLALSGCLLVGPDYVPPPPDVPDTWHQEATRGLERGETDLRSWWTRLRDPKLDELIQRAELGNLDLQRSVDRIFQARAARGLSTADRFPDADGTGTAERSRASEQVAGALAPPQSRVDTFYSLGGDSVWEADLWGRITRSIESADASLQASIEDYRDVLVSLYAEVAAAYVEVRTFQARIAFAQSNVSTQSGSLQLTTDRRNAGIGSDLEVAQAEQNLARTEAFVPSLRQGLARSVHALGVLLGEHPASLWAELGATAPIPEPPAQVTTGLPAELLRQRPDIRAVERQLAAQTAQIGVVTADLYPTFALNGTFAVQSFSAGSLFDSGSTAYGFGPSFRWNVFDGGRVRSQIRLEDARSEELLHLYEQTVLDALEEVENSMVSFVQEQDRRDALRRAVAASRKAVELVNTLYRTGLTDFQNVLDSERTLFEQEDQLAQSEGFVTTNLISLYRSLGGGWSAGTPGP